MSKVSITLSLDIVGLPTNLSSLLMCDISKINLDDLIMNQEGAIRTLKKLYLFNNQDLEERRNFLNSTSDAIEKG